MVFEASMASQADAFAKEERFEEAARYRAMSAQARLQSCGIRSHMDSDEAVADLLFAIYYAQRAGETTQATSLRNTLTSYAWLLQDAAYDALQDEWSNSTRACLVGLFEEWVGDAHLFTGSAEATRYYDRAEPWYRIEQLRARDDVLPCWNWGAEPQFFEALRAFFEYLEWIDPETADAWNIGDYDSLFFDRLDRKRELVDSLRVQR
ncbi:hypothetical protein [Haladaptatus sp. YSMS36]|uniref:hypothetical protein n=1 Tax=Haladaptatus sp. YSMS36 TaxID=3033384 RepID=UPI0023E7BA5E|nr:hypothetical protein [Haladaptatus sp. YSMS36]